MSNFLFTSGNSGFATPIPPATFAAGTPYSLFGDSMIYGDMRPKGPADFLNMALEGGLYFPTTYNPATTSVYGGNCGKSGETSAQIAARASAFAVGHNGVFIGLLGENDSASVTAGDQQTNWETIFTALSAAEKIYVIPFAETKTVYASSAIQARNAAVLSWLRTTATATYSNLEIFSDDVWDGITLHDGAGGAGPDSIEGIHPNNQGAKKLADNIYAEMQKPDGDIFDWTSGFTDLHPGTFLNLNSNTSGLTINHTTGTLAGSTSQILTITGTSPAGTVLSYLRSTINPGGGYSYDDDEGILIFGNFRLTASDNASAPVGLLAMGLNGAYGKQTAFSYYSAANEGGMDFLIEEGVFVGKPIQQGAIGITFYNSDLQLKLHPSQTIDLRFEVSNVTVIDIHDAGL